MWIRISFFLMALFVCTQLPAQQQERFSVYATYGPQINFFANSFDEVDGPQPHLYFYNKKPLGTLAGIGLQYRLNTHSYLAGEYAHSSNKARKNSSFTIDNVDIYLSNFSLRYLNNYFQLGYGRRFGERFSAEAGLVYVTTTDQSITYDGGTFGSNGLVIDEGNLKNSGSEEGGFYAGLAWEMPVDTKFSLGLRARGYYLLSISFFEAVSLTPTLRYRFGK